MRLKGKVEKGWGHETIFATNDLYCGKLLVFEKANSQFSMHFHSEKDETWYIHSGIFNVDWIDTKDASEHTQALKEGDTWRNAPLFPHRLRCIKPGTIIEVSTPDSIEDNYRVYKGDSQS